MTEADSKQQFESIQKIFQEIEQEFKNIHLFYMRLQEKYLEVRQLIETFLRKIRKNVTSFTEIVVELQLFENFDLKSLNTLINSDRLDNVLKSIEKAKQMLRKKPVVIFKADVSKVRKMTKSLEVDIINLGLSQTKDGALLLLSCVKSLRHKMHVHQEKKMQDRHFLSLLCYENFASFFSIPYIYLVLRTCGLQLFQGISPTEQLNMDKKFDEIQEFLVTETKPTAEATLRSWCHPQNLTASRLVHNYRIKQISTIFFAISGILLFAICIKLESDNSQNLHCALPNICLKCFLLQKISTNTINIIACCSYVVVLSLLCYQVATFDKKIRTNDCHLFDLLLDLSIKEIKFKTFVLSTNEEINEVASNNSFTSDEGDQEIKVTSSDYVGNVSDIKLGGKMSSTANLRMMSAEKMNRSTNSL